MEATKRPRSTDTEDDLIEMQEEYFKQKEGDPNLKPAAVAIRPESSGRFFESEIRIIGLTINDFQDKNSRSSP